MISSLMVKLVSRLDDPIPPWYEGDYASAHCLTSFLVRDDREWQAKHPRVSCQLPNVPGLS